MKTKPAQKNIPKGWKQVKLGDLFDFKNGLNSEKENFGHGIRFINIMEILKHDFLVAEDIPGRINVDPKRNKENLVEYGDVLFNRTSETPDEVGCASVLLDAPPEQLYLNSFCFALRPHSLRTLMPEFSRYLFHSPTYRRLVTVLAQGSTRFNISKSAFLRLCLPIPKDEREQQKIAGFLFSIDELITTQTQKLVTLKFHKKGLMRSAII